MLSNTQGVETHTGAPAGLNVEERLRKSEQLLVEAQARAKIGNWTWCPSEGENIWSRELYRIFELDEDRAPLGPEEFNERVHPEDRDIANIRFVEGQAPTATHFEIEYRIVCSGNRVKWIHGIVDREIDASGAVKRWSGTAQDITDRKRAELALKESEERWKFALEGAGDSVWDWDIVGRKTLYSKRWKDMLGYEDHEIGTDLTEWSSRVHPDDLPRAMRDLEAYFKGEKNDYSSEHRLRCKDGTYKWILDRGMVTEWDHDGNPVRMVGTNADISRRIASERQFDALAGNVPGVVYQFLLAPDKSTQFTYVSAGCQDVWGYAVEQILENVQLMLATIPNDESEAFYASILESARTLAPWDRKWKSIGADGTLKWLHGRARPERLANGHVVWDGVILDISEQHRSEEALTLARFSLDRATIPVYWVRPDGTFADVNEAAVKSLGYTREELLSLTVTDVDAAIVAENRPESWDRLRESGTLVFGGRHIRKDGTEFDVEVSSHYLEFGGSQLNCCFVRDLTEIQRSEAQRQQLELQLREAQKLEAIGTLAGGIAHGFNNLLAAILGNLELAAEDIDPHSPAMVSLKEITKAAARAKTLVQQILTFSRRQPHELSVVDLVALVDEEIGLLRSVLPSGIQIVSQLNCGETFAKVDPTQITQVLMNLCTNSWHAMSEARGIIEVQLAQVEVTEFHPHTFSDLNPGPYARLRVRDNGSGIRAECLDRIFEPFFTTKEVGKGTGLGLSVVHGIVKEHGGTIHVESSPGAGATFDIYLPLSSAPPPSPSSTSPASGVVDNFGQRILYIDDEEAMLFLVERMLKRKGYQTSAFDNPARALATFREDPSAFDLVVTDHNMPGASGLDVAREIQKIRPGMPVAIISGFVSDELIRKSKDLGVTEVIYKPNTVESLCESIRTLIG